MSKMSNRSVCGFLGVMALGLSLLVGPVHADVISDWNAKAQAIQVEKQLSPSVAAREMAILHVVMFEAVNAIDRRYAAYQLKLAAEPGFSKEATAAAAAYAVLIALYPDQQPKLDAALASSLAGIAEGEPKAKGIDLGRNAAAGILALRANDGAGV